MDTDEDLAELYCMVAGTTKSGKWWSNVSNTDYIWSLASIKLLADQRDSTEIFRDASDRYIMVVDNRLYTANSLEHAKAMATLLKS